MLDVDKQREVRRIRFEIERLLVTDADLDRFCLDYFPRIKKRFSAGMDRMQKVNLLLELSDLDHLLAAVAAEQALPQSSGVPRGSHPVRYLGLGFSLLGGLAIVSLGVHVAVSAVSVGESRTEAQPQGPKASVPRFPGSLGGTMRSNPSGARIIDMSSGHDLGTTPWPMAHDIKYPIRICVRKLGFHDKEMVLAGVSDQENQIGLVPEDIHSGKHPSLRCRLPVAIFLERLP